VVSALLVHRAHMPPQIADFPGLVVALRARVSARLSKLTILLWLWLWRRGVLLILSEYLPQKAKKLTRLRVSRASWVDSAPPRRPLAGLSTCSALPWRGLACETGSSGARTHSRWHSCPL
jgi:hypothetical protein